jgi:hypothetical protein
VGDVEVVGLRTGDEGAVVERGPRIVLALFKNVEIRADTDDLGCGLEGRAETLTIVGRNPIVRSSNGT